MLYYTFVALLRVKQPHLAEAIGVILQSMAFKLQMASLLGFDVTESAKVSSTCRKLNSSANLVFAFKYKQL